MGYPIPDALTMARAAAGCLDLPDALCPPHLRLNSGLSNLVAVSALEFFQSEKKPFPGGQFDTVTKVG